MLKLAFELLISLHFLLAHHILSPLLPINRALYQSYDQLGSRYHRSTGMRYLTFPSIELPVIDPYDSVPIRALSECLTNRPRTRQNGNIDKGNGGGCASV